MGMLCLGCKATSDNDASSSAASKAVSAGVPAAPSVLPAATQPTSASNDVPGDRFRDPPWFREDIVAGAKLVKRSRTERDQQGLFTTQLLLEPPAGTSVDACVQQLEAAVRPHVSELARTQEPDGRVTLRGSTDRYQVTLVCGEAKGIMKAFVGLQWTS